MKKWEAHIIFRMNFSKNIDLFSQSAIVTRQGVQKAFGLKDNESCNAVCSDPKYVLFQRHCGCSTNQGFNCESCEVCDQQAEDIDDLHFLIFLFFCGNQDLHMKPPKRLEVHLLLRFKCFIHTDTS